jgi:hypothetical protein
MSTGTKRTIVIVTVIGFVLAVAGAVVFLMPGPEGGSSDGGWKDKVDSNDPAALRKFIASEDFTQLPEADRVEAFDTSRKLREQSPTPPGERPDQGNLTDEERQRYRENTRQMFTQMMEKQVNDYVALPVDQRKQYLDKMIDQMQDRRKQFEGRPRPQPEQAAGNTEGGAAAPRPEGDTRRRGPDPDRLRQMIETTPPEKQAKFVQFMKDMQERMKERGIEGPRFGGGPPRN